MGFQADQADLDGLSNTINESLNSLNAAAGAPEGEVDAGESTAAVTGMMASLYESLTTMTQDTQQAAAEVADSGGVYTRTDDQAASGLPTGGSN
ncbi:hypothetical protein GIY23_05985 [Allosaccharopolyspora coralli]|uniref:Uncharacterized protein n=1 Tax=Allosaccharopolyspora coralli TaxID=2665642 RepID=A0A5Q3QCE3_9PSEU|nr:hypothetical protein [Allosaccharopolyspora coralli]QGK69145.1 hypothetical protein GIY23_05985 [Allosaccharopolyspora coralli]